VSLLEEGCSAVGLTAGRLLRPIGSYVDKRVDEGDQRFVDFYADFSPSVNGPYYRLAAAWLGGSGADTCLDVAGGPGNLGQEAGDARVIDLDLNPFMLERAYESGEEAVRSEATSLPFRDSAFGASTTTGAVHTFMRHDVLGEVMSEMERVADLVLALDFRSDASPREVSNHVREVDATGKLMAPGGIGLHGVTDTGEALDEFREAGLAAAAVGPYVAATNGDIGAVKDAWKRMLRAQSLHV